MSIEPPPPPPSPAPPHSPTPRPAWKVWTVVALVLLLAIGSAAALTTGDEPIIDSSGVSTSSGGVGVSLDRTDPVDLMVSESGYGSAGGAATYGAVVENPSSRSATDITVRVKALNPAGVVVATDQPSVNVIPPGGRFVVAGYLDSGRSKIARLKVVAHASDSREGSVPLPRVNHVRLEDEGYGVRTARAQLVNTLDGRLSPLAGVYGVFRDADGTIVGGDYTFPDGALAPGERTALRLDVVPDTATEVEITADNEAA